VTIVPEDARDAFLAMPGRVGAASFSGDAPSRALLAPETEARVFGRMRVRIVRTLAVQAIRRGRFRLVMFLALSGLLWTGLYWLFLEAFRFFDQSIPSTYLQTQTVAAVFGTFFMTLMVMLLFSAAIILFGMLFRGRDVAFLLTLPVRAELVFLVKFQEAVLFSGWAFVLLGSPMLLAYGRVADAPWYYFAMLLPFLLAFTYLPAAIGGVVCLGVVYRWPSGRARLGCVLACAAVSLALLIFWAVVGRTESNLLTPRWFQEILARLQVTQHRLLPSWWLCEGLLDTARGKWSEGVLYLGVLIANALFFRQVAIWTAAAVFRPAYSRVHTQRGASRRPPATWLDRAAMRAMPFVSPQVRLLIVKDFRLFRRDPLQWTQFFVFAGLLLLYSVNMWPLRYRAEQVGWVHIVSFLNVAVVGLLLSTFTTRFVFPMISLEGRRFWTLGLLPVRRDTILWSKFWFAVAGSLLPSALLILLSDLMLGIVPMLVVSHQVTCVVLCFGLSGIAVGLGACMPNHREQSPSRIAAGFGGTLNLVLSTVYILLVVLMTAVPSHFQFNADAVFPVPTSSGVAAWLHRWMTVWLVGGSIGSVVLGLAATLVPMVGGIRALRRAEF
jgi:ABC-2 type transport system permease protein